MAILSITPDPDTLTLTIISEFAAPPARIWQVWSDPRQLERWWGPPTWPATVTDFEFRPDGRVSYYMTGPEGQRAGGWWRIIDVDEPSLLEFEDGFATADGAPDPTMPVTRAQVSLLELDRGTRMTIASSFASSDDMRTLLDMGMDQGMGEAMGQIDAIVE